MGPLEDHAYAPVLRGDIYPPLAVEDRLTVDHDNAPVGMVQPGDETHQGGLASPGGSEDAYSVTLNGEVHIKGKGA